MPITDTAIKNAKPNTDKSYKLTDEKGLYVLIHSNGSKYFRLDYRFNGKRKTLAMGSYPDTSLKDAREKRDEARRQINLGIDPGEKKKTQKEAKTAEIERAERIAAGIPLKDSFKETALKWLESTAHKNTIQTTMKKQRRFERHVFTSIGDTPIKSVSSPDLLNLIKPLIDKRELETAHRVNSEISCVYAYAIAHGLTDYDPAQAVAKQIPATKVKHRAAITDTKQLGCLLRDIHNYQGTFIVQCAFKLSPLLFQRPGEIRQMEWKDIDLDNKEWRYLVTKTEVQHIVPLSRQASEILEAIKPLTGHGRYVFPSSRGDGRSMSENTISVALKALGYDGGIMTAHGFRSTASTLLNEQGWSPDAIERQLCHMPKDQVRAAYNRAQYLEERRRMMQAWADYLDGLKTWRGHYPVCEECLT